MLGVITGLKSEAKLLQGLKLACVSTGGQPREARRKIDRLIAEGATGLVSFGIAAAAGEISCILAAVLVLPALLEWRARRKGRGGDPSAAGTV